MITIASFAKINLGLKIGPARPDGFHELRTIYQTLALHDVIRVDVQPGSGIEIRRQDPRVPSDQSNTCYKVAERALKMFGARQKIVIEIEKHLPVQGGLGAASSNAVATMLAMERALGIELAPAEKLRIAADIGSDLPLFLIGGTVLGVGRGELRRHPLDAPRDRLVGRVCDRTQRRLRRLPGYKLAAPCKSCRHPRHFHGRGLGRCDRRVPRAGRPGPGHSGRGHQSCHCRRPADAPRLAGNHRGPCG